MIDKIKNSPLNLQATSVYNFNEFSLTELLNKFFSTINQCVDSSNQSLNFLTWLKGEGLPIEVEKELNVMYQDGRLTSLINNISGDLTNKINTFNSELNNKLDLSTSEINNKLDTKLNEVNEELIKTNTELEQKAIKEEISKFQKIARNTDGFFDRGAVFGVLANNDNPVIQVCGYNTPKDVALYRDRDSVAFYSDINGTNPTITYTKSDTVYTINTVVLPSLGSDDLSKVSEGMIIDTLNSNEWWCGIIENIDIENKKITVKERWYKTDTPDISSIPTNGSGVDINRVSKIFGRNTNIILSSNKQTKNAVGEEIGLMKHHEDGIIGGIDIVNFVKKARFGMTIRPSNGNETNGFNFGYVVSYADSGFESRHSDASKRLLTSALGDTPSTQTDYLDKGYSINNDGTQSKLKLFANEITSKSQVQTPHTSLYIFNIPNIEEDVPFISASKVGSGTIKFVKNRSNNYLYLTGNSFIDFNNTIRNNYLLMGGESVTLMSDGSAYYVLSDTDRPIKWGPTSQRPIKCLNGQQYFDTQLLKTITFYADNWYYNGQIV